MHKEILSSGQVGFLPIIKSFSEDFGLVGGTAIALHLGHRQSIDFDLFTQKEFDNAKIRQRILKYNQIDQVIRDEAGQFSLQIKGVRFTYLFYPYQINFSDSFKNIIKLPDLATLAAMKAFALGRRAKWKDYVDLYFIIKDHFSISEISKRGNEIFRGEFNEKLFRSQLAYFDDINYSETIIFMPGFEIDDEKIKQKLIEFSLS